PIAQPALDGRDGGLASDDPFQARRVRRSGGTHNPPLKTTHHRVTENTEKTKEQSSCLLCVLCDSVVKTSIQFFFAPSAIQVLILAISASVSGDFGGIGLPPLPAIER